MCHRRLQDYDCTGVGKLADNAAVIPFPVANEHWHGFDGNAIDGDVVARWVTSE